VVGPGIIKPLLFDEILTISLYGTQDELAELEGYLAREEDMSDINNVQGYILELALAVKARLKLGLKVKCCPKCNQYAFCVRKWLRAEREMDSNCCFRCHVFVYCSERSKKRHLQSVVRNENVSSAPAVNDQPPHFQSKFY
jgi:hypothetical protein